MVKEFCPTCGSAVGFDKSGHHLYGGRLAFGDFERILLSLGAAGSDVRQLWPEDPTPEACGNCGARWAENVSWNVTGGWTCGACGESDYPEAAE